MTKKKKVAESRVVTARAVQQRGKGAVPEAQLASTTLYAGRIIRLDRDTVRYPDGSVTTEFDIARHPGASAIVPFMSDPGGP